MISATFQKFTASWDGYGQDHASLFGQDQEYELAPKGNVLGGKGNCLGGGNFPAGYVREGKCPRGIVLQFSSFLTGFVRLSTFCVQLILSLRAVGL